MKTLLLTADHIPVKPIPIRKAMIQIFKGIYYPVKDHPTETWKSPSVEIPVPLAVAPFRHVPLPSHHFAPATLNNTNLFLRDNYTCVYCHEEFTHGYLTRDHVYPKSKGGKDIWPNVVTACQRCNHMKADLEPRIGPNSEFYWDTYDRETGDPIRLVLDFVPKAPSKLKITHAKEVKRGVLDPSTLYDAR